MSHRKFQKETSEWNVDSHFSSRLVKKAVTLAISRKGLVLSWDDHAVWELCGSGYTKMPTVPHKSVVKSAPYSDANPLTGLFKCVTNSLLFYCPAAAGDTDVKKKIQPDCKEVCICCDACRG